MRGILAAMRWDGGDLGFHPENSTDEDNIDKQMENRVAIRMAKV
jgi:hypothetical protein